VDRNDVRASSEAMTRLARLAVVIAVVLKFVAPAAAETDPAALYARD